MLTSPPPPSNRLLVQESQIANNNSSNNNKTVTNDQTQSISTSKSSSHQQQQQQQQGTASIVEVTALRFDVERGRAIIDQKTKHVQRLEAENSRLAEQLDKLRVIESDRRNNSESTLLVEIDSLKRSVRIAKDENVALELARESLTQKLETAERRASVLRQFEETNQLLHKDVALKDSEINKLRRELALAEKRIHEATQTSLCNVLTGKVGALEQMVDQRDKQVHDLRSDCAALEAALADARDANAELRDRCDQMDRLMSELRVATAALRSDLAANARLVDAQQQDFSKRHADQQVAKAHVEQRCTLLEELNSELRGEAREANRRAQDREFVITELQSELSVTRHELQAARHAASCAAEDERAAVDRTKKIQHLAADREAEIAKQHLLEQSLRSELESCKAVTNGLRADAERLRQEFNESCRRCDLLSHQAAQREGAEDRVRQMERQLQRTIEENDTLRENVAVARRREIDAESVLARQREQLSMIDRLQSELEEREARISALRREKQLADAELEALRCDGLTRATRATASPSSSQHLRPHVSPTRTKTVKIIDQQQEQNYYNNISPSRRNSTFYDNSTNRINYSPQMASRGAGAMTTTSTSNRTSVVFGRHSTPPPTTTSPIKRGVSPIGAGLLQIQQQQQQQRNQQQEELSYAVPSAVRPALPSTSSSALLASRRNLANANDSRNLISATVLTPERPATIIPGSSTTTITTRLGPRQM